MLQCDGKINDPTPIIPLQLVAGWLFCWLKNNFGRIIPGWIAHSIIISLGSLALIYGRTFFK
jgi:hypothetical protein